MAKELKEYTIDLEVGAELVRKYGHDYKPRIVSRVKDFFLLSFAYKEKGKKAKCYALPDFPNFKHDVRDDSALCGKLHDILMDADIVIGHNIRDFDRKVWNTRLLANGYSVPSPYFLNDTLKIVRSQFMLNNNTLDWTAKFLGVGAKRKSKKFSQKQLFEECENGNKKAYKELKKYNIEDVVINEKVWDKIKAFKNTALDIIPKGVEAFCTFCHATRDEIQSRGDRRYADGYYNRYQCKECDKWIRQKA